MRASVVTCSHVRLELHHSIVGSGGPYTCAKVRVVVPVAEAGVLRVPIAEARVSRMVISRMVTWLAAWGILWYRIRELGINIMDRLVPLAAVWLLFHSYGFRI